MLVSPKDLDSLESLLKAAASRNHRPLLDLAENAKEGEIPTVSYYRKCRSLFTMKRELEKISQAAAAAEEIPESNVESGEQRPRRQEPSTSRTYPEICIFCQKKTRYKKFTRTCDPLIIFNALTCLVMPPLERLLLLRVIAESLALSLVIW